MKRRSRYYHNIWFVLTRYARTDGYLTPVRMKNIVFCRSCLLHTPEVVLRSWRTSDDGERSCGAR